MATDISIQETLDSFVAATESASQGVPDLASLLPPENGITLLDTKSEIFLSYLQALALRNLNVIRSIKNGVDVDSARETSKDITRKLVEHRIYLERGVRPLEQKIKYQVDRVVKAAEDRERTKLQQARSATLSNGQSRRGDSEDSDSQADSDESNDDDDSDASEGGGMDPASLKPNLKMMQSTVKQDTETSRTKGGEGDVYRPPRISATAMPDLDRRERAERRPARSRTLDEYVSTELSAVPLAEPSIGSNIALGGRRNKSARQLAEEKERRDYEETNLVRLPKESKKERAKKGLRGRDAAGGHGGEDWRELGDSVDRIGDLTRRKTKDSALDRSRKRRAVDDGPRDSGMGSAFDIKKQRLMKKRR